MGMWRVIGVIERMGSTLGQASVMLTAVLDTMDTEMGRLHRQLEADATELRVVVAALDVTDEERKSLTEVVERIEHTAARVASFAHRPEDAEDEIDALLDTSGGEPQVLEQGP